MTKIATAGALFDIIDRQRDELGISQRDLCKRAGLAHGTYWYAASRGGDMTLRAALAYCNVLGLSVRVTKGRGQ